MKNNENFDLPKIWKNCKEIISSDNQIKKSFNLIIEEIKLFSIEKKTSTIILTANTEFSKILLETSYFNQVKDVLNNILNSNFEMIIFTIDEIKNYENVINNNDTNEMIMKLDQYKNLLNDGININLNFENFFASEANKPLYNAAITITNNFAKWNPFFIFGDSGLGKTHLLHSIGNKAKSKINLKIKYIESREFSKIIHHAKQAQNIYEEFSKIYEKFDSYDLLLIDDIQFIASQTKSKEIFFNIFNSFITRQKQIVISSDKFPEEIKDFEDRFITRFKAGLIMGVVPPDIETTIKIIKHKLKSQNFNLSIINEESYYFIAENFSNNVRELEGAINRIVFENIQDLKKEFSIDRLKEIFKNIIPFRKNISISKIIILVANYFKISKVEIVSNNRSATYVKARQLVIYISKIIFNFSIKEISLALNKNHSSIISSLKKIISHYENDKDDVKKIVFELKKQLNV